MCNRSDYYKKWKHHAKRHYHRHHGPGRWGRGMHLGIAGEYPPVNIRELDDGYELHVYAPGLTKEDFQISVVDRILTIKVDRPERNTEDTGRWRRQEFRKHGFKREFELNDKINTEAIQAEYTDGILLVKLPKLEGFETVRQDIEIV